MEGTQANTRMVLPSTAVLQVRWALGEEGRRALAHPQPRDDVAHLGDLVSGDGRAQRCDGNA